MAFTLKPEPLTTSYLLWDVGYGLYVHNMKLDKWKRKGQLSQIEGIAGAKTLGWEAVFGEQWGIQLDRQSDWITWVSIPGMKSKEIEPQVIQRTLSDSNKYICFHITRSFLGKWLLDY